MRRKYTFITAVMAIAMAATLVIPGGVRSAKAATNSASTYAELLSAISTAADGDSIEITSDIIVENQLNINKTLTINGNGHTISVPVPGFDDSGVINTSPSIFRVFNITTGTVTISNTTIKGGSATGAGIYVTSGVQLYLEGVTISNCGGTTSRGGGLYNTGAVVFLKNCNIIRNGAQNGGGFLNINNGQMFIENCSFSENRSLSSGGGGGAGENQAYLYINNSTFSNNKSTELGGAINNYGGTAYILNSTFTGNVNISSLYLGGALRTDAPLFLVNDIFAYNYTSQDGNSYILNDFDDAFWSNVAAYNCMFHGSTFVNDVSASNTGANITQYTGLANGSNDTLFTGGSTSQVLAADGTLYGTAEIYQPYLARVAGGTTRSVPLQAGSTALNAGIQTSFTNGNGTPVIGYYAGGTWVELTSTSATEADLVLHRVAADQNSVARTESIAIGAVESTVSSLYMVKVNKAAGGTVIGGSVFGDTYASGGSVNLLAIPDSGYQFVEWDYFSGEIPGREIDNPYSFTVMSSVTITPVFEALAQGEYIITYAGNGNDAGFVPASSGTVLSAPASISGNTGNLVKAGYIFNGWNTRADGSGTAYSVGAGYSGGFNLMLYAQWVQKTVTPPAETDNGPVVGIPSTGDNGSVLYGWLLCAASLACIATRKVYRKHQARHKQ